MKRSVAFDLEGLDDDARTLLGYPPRRPKAAPGEKPRAETKPSSVNLPRGNGADPVLLREKTRLATEQADKIALANAKARGELVSAVAVEREWSAILRELRSALLAMPTRLQQRAPHLTAHDIRLIDRELRDLLTEMGNAPAAAPPDEQAAPGGTDDRT